MWEKGLLEIYDSCQTQKELSIGPWYDTVQINICWRINGDNSKSAAGDCEESLQFSTKTYVDEMDDLVNKAYAAWPTRLYLINVEGMVIYAGGLGPFGFKPGGLKQAIEEHITEEKIP